MLEPKQFDFAEAARCRRGETGLVASEERLYGVLAAWRSPWRSTLDTPEAKPGRQGFVSDASAATLRTGVLRTPPITRPASLCAPIVPPRKRMPLEWRAKHGSRVAMADALRHSRKRHCLSMTSRRRTLPRTSQSHLAKVRQMNTLRACAGTRW